MNANNEIALKYRPFHLLINSFIELLKANNKQLDKLNFIKCLKLNPEKPADDYAAAKAEMEKIIKEEKLPFSIADVIKEKDKLFAAEQKEVTPFHEPDKSILEILRDENLLNRIIDDLQKKITGETDTLKATFLCLCGIWVKNHRNKRTHVQLQGGSSGGKDHIAYHIVSYFPERLWVYKSRISEKALAYLHANERDWSWDGKILYLEDIGEDILNSDVHKVYLSKGSDSTIVIKGIAVNLKVNGQAVEIMSTSASEANNEVVNRYFQINVDVTQDQTEKVLEFEAKEEMGKCEEWDVDLRNSLNFLTQVNVSIPFADKLVKHFPKGVIKARREFPRLLAAIKNSAALHQYRRQKDEKGHVVAAPEDYNNAVDVIKKTSMTISLQSLTTQEQEMLNYCKQAYENSTIKKGQLGEFRHGFLASDVINKHPVVNQAMWYRYLDKLAEKGYLVGKYIKEEDSDKPRKYWKIQEVQILKLPYYEELNENK